jgi:beta-phosphoglucomutase-like phosphatase (HAD superfamily)
MDASLGSCVVIKDSFAGIEGVAVAGIMCLAIWRRYLNCCLGFNGS